MKDDILTRAKADPSRSDTWFAWYPVEVGAFGGRWVWLRRVWRNRCAGVTIYQRLDDIRRTSMIEKQQLNDVLAEVRSVRQERERSQRADQSRHEATK